MSKKEEDVILTGYELMYEYITENRIKTKNRKFLRKLDKFHRKYTRTDYELTREDKLEWLELEKEFYTTICKPVTREQEAILQTVRILTSDT